MNQLLKSFHAERNQRSCHIEDYSKAAEPIQTLRGKKKKETPERAFSM